MGTGASDHLGPASAQHTVQPLAEQLLGHMTQHSLHVGADLQDRQLGLCKGKQQAMGLNGAGKLNGLIRTIGQKDFKGVFVELAHNSTF